MKKYIIKRLAQNIRISFVNDKTIKIEDFKNFFFNCARLDRLLLNLLKKTYPTQIVLILFKLGFNNLSMFGDLSKMEVLSQECQNLGFKVSKIKPSQYNPKYYEFFVLSERESFVSSQIGPEIILEKDYREAFKIFTLLKDYLGYKLKIEYKGETRVWDNWIYSLNEILQYLRDEGRKGLFIQRYKGLGEMNSKQLWETTMDPQRRVLKKVSIQDAEKADELFSVLMGENVEPRREFIYQHALEYRELDI
jgi:DNA gyrase subunit B